MWQNFKDIPKQTYRNKNYFLLRASRIAEGQKTDMDPWETSQRRVI